MSDILSWLWEQAKVASPFVAVFSMAVNYFIARALWMRHVRDLEDLKAIARAQLKAQEADAKAKAKIAGAIGALTAKLGRR